MINNKFHRKTLETLYILKNKNMLKINSNEWKDFIQKLEIIKTKSNREVLCISCWQMLNCKQKIKHLKKYPDHEKYLLTSTKYASEKQIISLAKT